MWSFIDFALNTLILNVVLLHSFLFLYYWFCLSTSSTITLSYKFKNGLPLEGLNFVSGTSIILNFETNLAKNIFISVIANLCPIQTRWPDPKGLQVNSTILSAFPFKNRSGWNELGSGKNSSSKKWERIYKSWFANFFHSFYLWKTSCNSTWSHQIKISVLKLELIFFKYLNVLEELVVESLFLLEYWYHRLSHLGHKVYHVLMLEVLI